MNVSLKRNDERSVCMDYYKTQGRYKGELSVYKEQWYENKISVILEWSQWAELVLYNKSYEWFTLYSQNTQLYMWKISVSLPKSPRTKMWV